jgi:methylenetetrahydrofolate reductase (NADPH)
MFLGSRVQLVGIWDVQARRHNKCDAGLKHQQVGIEWCAAQSKELMAAGVPVLHYYSMGKSDAVKQIASQLF